MRPRPLALCAAALVIIVTPASAAAATIAVDTTADAVAADAACSLREALANANNDAQNQAGGGECAAGAGTDTVTVPSGTIALGSSLSITSAVTLRGAGASSTELDGVGSTRVLMIAAPGADVVIEDLEVTRGRAPTPGGGKPGPVTGAANTNAIGTAGPSGENGGGILATGGTLALTRVRFFQNRGGMGFDGGDATGGTGSGTGTGGVGGTGGSGGALYATVPVVVRDSVFEENSGGPGGGGGFGRGGNATSSAVSAGGAYGGAGGWGGNGGAIATTATLTVERSTFRQNTSGQSGPGGAAIGGAGADSQTNDGASGFGVGGLGGTSGNGGAIYVGPGTGLTITQSTFALNSTGTPLNGGDGTGGTLSSTNGGTGTGSAGGAGTGGTGGKAGDGSAVRGLGTATISSTLFHANFANSGGRGGVGRGGSGGFSPGGSGPGGSGFGGQGGSGGRGAISVEGAQSLINVTSLDNAGGWGGTGGGAQGANGGSGGSAFAGNGGNAGAGFVFAVGVVTIRTSTFSSDIAGLAGPGSTSAVAGTPGGTATVGASGSTGSSASVLRFLSGGSSAGTIYRGEGPVQCSGNGTLTSADDLGGVEGCPGAAGDPNLGSLADNGGPTQTLRLGDGSAALDALPTGANCATTDQRGVTRPRGSACDIGAYERAAPDATTESAEAISSTGATLRGTANPNGPATTVRFVFGTSTAYGSATPGQSVGPGLAAASVVAVLTGLTPSTTYSYRIEATSPDGAAVGEDRTFTTPAASSETGPGGAVPGGSSSDTVAPRFLAASLSPTTLKRRMNLRWTLSEAARITVTFKRRLPGRRSGTRCVKPTASNRRARACKRYVTAASVSIAAKRGAGSRAFTRKVGGKILRPGRYRVRLVARDAAGNRSVPRVLSFRVAPL